MIEDALPIRARRDTHQATNERTGPEQATTRGTRADKKLLASIGADNDETADVHRLAGVHRLHLNWQEHKPLGWPARARISTYSIAL